MTPRSTPLIFALTLALITASSPVSAATSSSSSAADTASCPAPNTLECNLGYRPTCVDGEWQCKKRSSGNGKAPVLTSLEPSRVFTGKPVTIIGSGFAKTNNVIHIGDFVILNVYSTNGKNITFRVPRIITPACLFERPACDLGVTKLEKGTYELRVESERKLSEPLTLKILK